MSLAHRMSVFPLAVLWLSVAAPHLLAQKDMPRVPLDGTRLLEMEGDIASAMVDSIDRFLMKEIEVSVARRGEFWQPDFSHGDAFRKSVEPNRQRFRTIIGAVDERRTVAGFEYVGSTTQDARIGAGPSYEVYAVRWPVLHGLHGAGLLLVPNRRVPLANVVAIPDADQTPEMLAGLVAGVDPASQTQTFTSADERART